LKKDTIRRGASVRWLLLGVNALILLVPIVTFLSLRLYQSQLVRQTETKLIAESVVIAEAWRGFLLDERGLAPDQAGSIRPEAATDERYWPINPLLGDDYEVLARVADPASYCHSGGTPAWRAGSRLKALLDRAKIFNLTSARMLDEKGCVVATTGTWLGADLSTVPEVRAALSGQYAAAARERLSDEPKPGLYSISRRGDVRVFTATPVIENGKVLGAVWMSRTAMDPIKAAWKSRRPLLFALGLSLGLTVLVSLLLAWQITRPLRQITAAASRIARGERTARLVPGGTVPSEIHELGAAISTMAAQLSDRANYIAEFAANVSHELKSPITSIQGAAELLFDEAEGMPTEQRQKFLANIRADASRMERLVVRLLELARIQSAPESSETLALQTFLEGIVESYDGRVVLEPSAAPAEITINPEHLESALRNLLGNAVRHGGSEPVSLTARACDDRFEFLVSDKGQGISPANQPRLFDRFFTTERDRGGTGLGLAIVQAVAKTRGGEVSFDTSERGTTFRLVV
jgi:signal transduction histidine kinase